MCMWASFCCVGNVYGYESRRERLVIETKCRNLKGEGGNIGGSKQCLRACNKAIKSKVPRRDATQRKENATLTSHFSHFQIIGNRMSHGKEGLPLTKPASVANIINVMDSATFKTCLKIFEFSAPIVLIRTGVCSLHATLIYLFIFKRELNYYYFVRVKSSVRNMKSILKTVQWKKVGNLIRVS